MNIQRRHWSVYNTEQTLIRSWILKKSTVEDIWGKLGKFDVGLVGKGKCPFLSSSSFGWPNNQTNRRQINKRKSNLILCSWEPTARESEAQRTRDADRQEGKTGIQDILSWGWGNALWGLRRSLLLPNPNRLNVLMLIFLDMIMVV